MVALIYSFIVMILVSTYGTNKQKLLFYSALVVLSVPSLLYSFVAEQYFDASLIALFMFTLVSSLYPIWKKRNEQTNSL